MENTKQNKSIVTWMKNLGLGAFTFFMLKGMVWLAIFLGLFEACK